MKSIINAIQKVDFEPPVRYIAAIAALMVLVEAVVFLDPAAIEFPMDDAYIHFAYADNLVEHGRLFFSNPEEKGVGVTSPLWVWLLAGFKFFGVSMPLIAKLMGMLGLICVSTGLYALFHPIWKSPSLLLAIFLVTISGNLIWFSLSGMETVFFLALGIFVLISFRGEKWVAVGVLGGALVLTRPEGAILLLSIGVIDVLANRRIRSGVLLAITISIFISAPWFIYLHQRTGYFLPTSAIGKQFTFSVGMAYVGAQNSSLSQLIGLRFLSYPFAWLGYSLLFALGGKSLPGPSVMENNGSFGISSYAPSIWAIPGWLLVVLPLVIAGFGSLRKQDIRHKIKDPASGAALAFGLWFVLHNLVYMFFMPVLGTASRYGALNHIILWMLLAAGIDQFGYSRLKLGLLTMGLLTIAAANTMHWNSVYDANIEHMQQVRIAAAGFIRDTLPQNELCAAMDIGAVHYFSGRPIIDMGGLTDPDIKQWFIGNKVDLYLMNNKATCLILPGQADTAGGGWFDFVEILGLDKSPYFQIEQIVVFDMDYDRWLKGYMSTYNQQWSVVIYKMDRMGNSAVNTP